MQTGKTAYKCIRAGLSYLNPENEMTYDIFVSVLSYGKHAGLGHPPLDLEPKVCGLLKEDAIFWALGQAQMMVEGGDWRITKRDLEGDKTKYVIWLEDELGARREISILEASDPVMRKPLQTY